MHKCPHCKYRFEDAESLRRHLEEGMGCPELHDQQLPGKGARVKVTGTPHPDPYSGFVDPCPMEVGATGIVRTAANPRTRQIDVVWDNGRSLFLLTTDPFEVTGEGWEVTTCDPATGCDCTEAIAWPPEGEYVTVMGSHETREPGDDDEKPITVPHGATGWVRGWVEEWHHVHVELANGQHVWLDPTDLNPKQPTCQHCARPVRETSDPGVPLVHSDSGNGFCDVAVPADAVHLAGTVGRTLAEV